MSERPSWIEAFFAKKRAGGAFESRWARDRQRWAREDIVEQVGDDPKNADDLRQAALDESRSDDIRRVELALECLMVVGRQDDLAAVAHLDDHPSEYIRRAAKACRFALRQNG